METRSHLFFECHESYRVWMECFNWLGVSTVMYNNCAMHLEQFSSLSFCNSQKKDCWISIWLAIIWTVWLARNEVVFSSTQISAMEMVDLVKIRTWNWLRTRHKDFRYDFASWSMNPVACLT
uniref:Reverse transcriptase zinc-binding domain-containing protein n=1 Tax=Cajanus cajan TaxID=3821 RepID=A0A151SXX5_CAJCA|nr:hypothetical protein KK1_015090 [Cajanus cajan]